MASKDEGWLTERSAKIQEQVVSYNQWAGQPRQPHPMSEPTTQAETPRYQHDCDRCLFLGRYEWLGEHYDLYAADHGGNPCTMIARYGDGGADCISGSSLDHPLGESVHRVIQRAFALQQEHASLLAALKDPHVVHVNMLRGQIAPLSEGNVLHLHPELRKRLELAEGENVALREALEKIRDECGQVCGDFETCTHPACQSSYSAWAIADAALRATRWEPPPDKENAMPEDTPAVAQLRQEFEAWISRPPFEHDVARCHEDHSWPQQYVVYRVQLAWEAVLRFAFSDAEEPRPAVDAPEWMDEERGRDTG